MATTPGAGEASLTRSRPPRHVITLAIQAHPCYSGEFHASFRKHLFSELSPSLWRAPLGRSLCCHSWRCNSSVRIICAAWLIMHNYAVVFRNSFVNGVFAAGHARLCQYVLYQDIRIFFFLTNNYNVRGFCVCGSCFIAEMLGVSGSAL